MVEVKRFIAEVDSGFSVKRCEVVLVSDYDTLEADRDRLKVIADNYSALLMDANAENAKLRAELERRAVLDNHTEQALVMVPVKPSQAMISAGWKVGLMGMDRDGPQAIYAAMLAAAPSAPKADDPVKVQGDDAARLDFMLIRNRKVVVERLPNDNFAVYVEEGFMGDKVYPSVSYSGEWASGSSEELELKREAIDAAIAAARQEGGKV